MSFLVPLIAWLGAIASGWVTLSHLVRMARKGKSMVLDWSAITAPLYGGICAACLTVAGFIGMAAGVILAVLLLGLTAVMIGDSWRKARKLPAGAATRRIFAALGHQAWGGREYIRQDAQAIAARFRRDREPEAPEAGAPAAAGRAAGASPEGWPAFRQVPPPLRADPAVGSAPPAAEVAETLAAAGVMVDSAWARVAEHIGDFEAADEDDLMAFMAETAAGILAVADAWFFFAENLGDGAKLDPAYILGLFDLGDEFAGLASAAVLAHRLYHHVYGNVHEHVDSDGTLPADARTWFGAEGGSPAGGRAA